MKEFSRRDKSRWFCSLLFVVAGIAHFVIPDSYAEIVPPYLPEPELLVVISGIAEIAGGIGLQIARVRLAAAYGLIALLIAVFPANIQMLVDATRDGADWWWLVGLWVRLPIQLLLISWVWKVRR